MNRQQTTSVDKLRYMMLTVVVALMSMVTFSSCGGDDDDEPLPAINDYYVQFNFTGGGLSEQELSQITANFNANLQSEFSWKNISSDQAIYNFNKVVDAVKKTFADGYSGVISGTMDVAVILKTKDGKTVKTEIVHVTRTGLA